MFRSNAAEKIKHKNKFSELFWQLNLTLEINTTQNMKTYIACLVLSCFFFAATAQPSSQSVWEALDAKVAAVNITDFFFLLGNEDGVFYTYQKGTKITNTTSMPVASGSKWVSSVVFNTLILNGTLSFLDQPQDYIDWWTKDPSDPRSRVRLQHLLNFQSGFTISQDCLFDQTADFEECVKIIYNSSLDYEPGEVFYYSENHMHILGLMVQKKTGRTYNQIFTEIIKKPLGLTVSTFPGSNPRPSSSLNTNAVEYEKILRSIYLKTILPAEVINMMDEDQTNVTIQFSPAQEYNVGWHYALGHWVECPHEQFEQSCLTDIFRRSSPGALGFYPWIDRKMNYYGILATYQNKGILSALQVDAFRDEIEAAVRAVSPTPVAEPTSSTSPSSANTPSNSNTTPKSVTASASHVSAVVSMASVLLGIALL